tara:strand:- start:381 stop:923 length:543 start_codon:yes stop_codon:yes gene_type:complete
MLDITNIAEMFPINHERVGIRLFTEKDITKEYISWLNDPEVVKFSNQRFKFHDSDSSKAFLKYINSLDAIFLKIIHKQSDEFIGTMTVYFSLNHSTADIGIMVGNRKFWNQGIGAEAWTALMNFLLDKLNVRKVTGGTLSCNRGMIRIFEKVGMIQDGIRIEQEIFDDKAHDIVYFAKFK